MSSKTIANKFQDQLDASIRLHMKKKSKIPLNRLTEVTSETKYHNQGNHEIVQSGTAFQWEEKREKEDNEKVKGK